MSTFLPNSQQHAGDPSSDSVDSGQKHIHNLVFIVNYLEQRPAVQADLSSDWAFPEQVKSGPISLINLLILAVSESLDHDGSCCNLIISCSSRLFHLFLIPF